MVKKGQKVWIGNQRKHVFGKWGHEECLKSLIIGEIHIKKYEISPYNTSEYVKLKRPAMRMGSHWASLTERMRMRLMWLLWKTVGCFLIQLNMHSPYDSALMFHWEKTALNESGSKLSRYLYHGLPSSTTVRNKCSLFKPPTLWHFCYSCPKLLRQGWIVSPPNSYVEALNPSILNVTVVGHGAVKRRLS